MKIGYRVFLHRIANTRIMGVGISGLLGGPIVGIGVGSIAGIHRYMLGGTTALSCAISSILAGVITGYIGYIFKNISVQLHLSFQRF